MSSKACEQHTGGHCKCHKPCSCPPPSPPHKTCEDYIGGPCKCHKPCSCPPPNTPHKTCKCHKPCSCPPPNTPHKTCSCPPKTPPSSPPPKPPPSPPHKTCEDYTGGHCKRHKLYRGTFACLLSLLILILLTILIIWLVLRPTKPTFYLRDLSLSQFNLTRSDSLNCNYFLTSNLQVTISSRNPNARIGIYYDKLDVYAEYKNQPITVPTALPTGYQGHDDFAVWSPFLYGTEIPISPYLNEALSQDESAGFLLFDVKVEGRLGWKVGSWVSGHYHIYVNCPVFMTVNGNGGGWGFKFQQMTTCHVDV